MNKKTTYEVLIAEKVNHLPIPDMADAIWANIELGLDAVLDDNGVDQQALSDKSPANSLTTATKIWLGIITMATIVALIIVFTKNNSKEKTAEPKDVPSILQDEIKKQKKNPHSDKTNDIPGIKSIIPYQQKKNDSTQLMKPSFTDSVFKGLLKKDGDDSSVVVNKPATIAMHDSITIIPPAIKKPRGVKGIGDGDYKITSGKKDSL